MRYQLIELPKVLDARGSLTAIEGGTNAPFDIARTYYLYDVPAGATRAGHAHFKLRQLMIACAGSFDVHLDDGFSRAQVTLNRPNVGLLIESMVWRTIENFSGCSVCMVLASLHYDEADYIRDYDQFLRLVRAVTPA